MLELISDTLLKNLRWGVGLQGIWQGKRSIICKVYPDRVLKLKSHWPLEENSVKVQWMDKRAKGLTAPALKFS